LANLVLAFGEVLVGAILLDAAVKGDSIPNVIKGVATSHPLAGSSTAAGGGGATNSTGGNVAAGSYTNPVPGASLSRTDQGVDYTLSSSTGFLAPGKSQIVSTAGTFGGGPLIVAELLDGPYKGAQYYVGEGVRPAAGIVAGAVVNAGQKLADVAVNPSNGILGNIEAGWWSPTHNRTLAQASGVYSEGAVTAAGAAWDTFVRALGGVAHTADSVAMGNLAGMALGDL
jgi:hypothetical protein